MKRKTLFKIIANALFASTAVIFLACCSDDAASNNAATNNGTVERLCQEKENQGVVATIATRLFLQQHTQLSTTYIAGTTRDL